MTPKVKKEIKFRCPKCGGDLADFHNFDPEVKGGYRYQCQGRIVAVGVMGIQRSRSCGVFTAEQVRAGSSGV